MQVTQKAVHTYFTINYKEN